MVSKLALALSSAALLVASTHAIKLPLTVRRIPGSGSGPGLSLEAQSPNPNGFEVLTNRVNNLYLIQAELGGATFNFHLDTGSTDLWVITNFTGQTIELTNTTNVTANITYGDASGVSGPVVMAELQLAGYTIPSQAFLDPNATMRPEILNLDGRDGIIGVGFDTLSVIDSAVTRSYGNHSIIGQSPLSNIFTQNTSIPHCLDLYLSRSDDLESSQNGTFLIGEHAQGFEDVVDQPKLWTVSDRLWAVALDQTLVNGKEVPMGNTTITALRDTGKIGAVLDTGTSVALVSPEIEEAIYSPIPFASRLNDSDPTSPYVFPCLSMSNVSFVFGGREIAIHPLDLSSPSVYSLQVNDSLINATLCTARFQSGAPSIAGSVDIILGDSFLRNVYQSFVYGNETDGQRLNNGSYIQLVPLTNATQAWADFQTSRTKTLQSMPPDFFTLPEIQQALNSSTGNMPSDALASTSPSSKLSAETDSGSSSSQLVGLVDKYGPVVIGLLAGNVLVGVLLLLVAIIYMVRRPSMKTRAINPSYAPVRFKEPELTEERYHDNDG